jgi:hypothetical protein
MTTTQAATAGINTSQSHRAANSTINPIGSNLNLIVLKSEQ